MREDEFLARVRERGEYGDQAEAERVTASVLRILASRIPDQEAKDLAAQLPGHLGGYLTRPAGEITEAFGVQEFCRRVSDQVGARPATAEWDASAVLTTIADVITGGQLNQILSVLPSGYASLFGKPDLA